jgi:hypothetical protein
MKRCARARSRTTLVSVISKHSRWAGTALPCRRRSTNAAKSSSTSAAADRLMLHSSTVAASAGCVSSHQRKP